MFLKDIWPQNLVIKKKKSNDVYKAKEESLLTELANDTKFKV